MAEFNDAKWYVVHTYSGYENKVATDLQTIVENRGFGDLIMDIKIPTEKVTEIKDLVTVFTFQILRRKLKEKSSPAMFSLR